MISMTTGAMIDKYIEVRDYVQAKKKELDEHLQTYKDAMQAIENELLVRLNRDNAKSAKAESGAIAFKQLATHARVVDREAWLAWLASHWEEGQAMLTTHVSKEAIASSIQAQGFPPAGVEVNYIWGVNFRRAT
jgi:hypothetical protein